jgi:catechol 2,3-dioxygenase-like lactoylglutathione lyase family enzyme
VPTRYYHTGIVAEDPDRIARFYTDVFGCEPTGDRHDLGAPALARGMGHPGAHITGLDLRLPGFGADGPVLEIFRLDSTRRGRPEVDVTGFMHIAFSVDDVTETLERVLEGGGSRLGDVSVLEVDGVGTATMVYARDPEGNIVEIQMWEKHA